MEVLGYDLNKDNSDFVSEGYDLFSNKNYVYTTNLYSCVGLYAITEEGTFLGHINVQDRREFRNGKTVKVYNLLDELLSKPISGKVFIGIVNGVALDDYEGDKYETISYDLNEVIDKLMLSLDVERLDDLASENILIDVHQKILETDYDTIDLRNEVPKM